MCSEALLFCDKLESGRFVKAVSNKANLKIGVSPTTSTSGKTYCPKDGNISQNSVIYSIP